MNTLIFILLLIPISIFAQNPVDSAIRGYNESFRGAYERHISKLPFNYRSGLKATGGSPYDNAVDYSELNLKLIPEVSKSAYQKGMKIIQKIRDQRIFPGQDQFPRRLSWLYPQDGCFMRAEYMKNDLLKAGFEVKKIFVFGELNTVSPFSANGSVRWWYHVAPVFRVGSQAFVIDPSINAFKPLSVKAWVLSQSKSVKNVRLAVCHEDSYTPSSSCHKPKGVSGSTLSATASNFLAREKSNLKALGYNLQRELGDLPYWNRLDGLIVPNWIQIRMSQQ